MLFRDKPRTYDGPRSYTESDWKYLDRSGRVEAHRVRALLDKWCAEYPSAEQGELRARIVSSDRRAFQSAMFELILFAGFRSLGCTVEVHPELDGESTKRPDFLVTTPGGAQVYAEAVLASEYSQEELAAGTRVNVVLAAINGIDSPDFFLWINAEGSPDTPPRGRALANDLQQWIRSLAVDEVEASIAEGGSDAAPVMEWAHEGWRVTFKAFPWSAQARGGGQPEIGAMSGEARWINAWEPIRDAVKAKGGRYGVLPHPLLVCVSADALSVDRIDEMEALFGQEEYVFDGNNLAAQPQMRRRRNGAWSGPSGPRYKRVSGAWIFHALGPWNMASRQGTLYFNPWAERPLPTPFETLASARVGEGGLMEWVDGRSIGGLLGLAEGWPK